MRLNRTCFALAAALAANAAALAEAQTSASSSAMMEPKAIAVPKPAADLVAGTSLYRAVITRGSQIIEMMITRTVKDGGDTWVITERATMAAGEAVDEAVVEKGTLLVKKRSVRQGPLAIDLVFDATRVTGLSSMDGAVTAVSVALDGPLFADGAGANDVLARLPLAPGYEATFGNLDIQKQKVTTKRVRFTGLESVSVPAGTFRAWKAEVSTAEGEAGLTTLWIHPQSRRVLKIGVTRPGGTITAELQPDKPSSD